MSSTSLDLHRDRLIRGLEASIREKGLAATQVTDIVAHARASRATFYRCFADKTACFLALGETLFDETRLKVAGAVDPDSTWDEQVDQALSAYLRLVAEDRGIAVTFTSEVPALGQAGRELRSETLERNAQMLVALTSSPRAIEEHIGPISLDMALMLMTGLEELVARAILRDEPVLDLLPVISFVFKRALAPSP